jgi:transposase
VPKPYPRKFRDDVVRVARDRDPGVTVEQVAKDFGVHPMKWMRQAEVDEGAKPGVIGRELAELREARRRIKLLEQENEVLRRAAAHLSQARAKVRLSRQPHRDFRRHEDWRPPESRSTLAADRFVTAQAILW